MTIDECTRPFAMLHANWPFLDFSDEITAGIWFEAFKSYSEPEVRQGISDAIANITGRTAPVVADILEYVKGVHDGFRRLEAEENAKKVYSSAVSCQKCNDHGFVTIIYPTGYETSRSCDCAAATKIYGEKTLRRQEDAAPAWRDAMMFGENEIPSQYQLVRVIRVPVPTGEYYKNDKGEMMPRLRWGYGPYQVRGGSEKEEIFMQYQKRRRK